MSKLSALRDDHSRELVPQNETVTDYRIALIIVGFSITLPLLVAGSKIGLTLVLRQSLIAFFDGALVPIIVWCITAYVGASARISTYKI